MLLALFGPAFRCRNLKLNYHNCISLKAIDVCLIDVTEECLDFFSFLLMDKLELDILNIRWSATGNHYQYRVLRKVKQLNTVMSFLNKTLTSYEKTLLKIRRLMLKVRCFDGNMRPSTQ
jgi:hypothetical protein